MIGTNAKTVSTDATLTGNGTSGSPLSVAAPGLASVTTDTTLTGAGTVGSPLSVAAPGLASVTTDTTLTGSGTVGSPLSVADPSAGGSKLMRVDTGAWEPARRSNGVITAVADAGGGVCTVTSAGHQQADGATVTIAGTTDYNGDYVIANVTADTFDITETFTVSRKGTFSAENIYWVPSVERNGDWPGGARPKRRFYKGTTGVEATTLWASFPHAFLRAHGTVKGTPGVYPIQSYSVAGTLLRVAVEGSDLILRCGSDFDGASDLYFVTVDYYEP
jgi:hypothetical protein